MTDTTDIAALRSEAANIIGLLTAEGHQSFTLDKTADFFDDVFRLLEAERQRVEELAARQSKNGVAKLQSEVIRLRIELAALKGEQVPVEEADYTRYSCGCCGFESLHHTTKCPECNYHKIELEPLFTAPQKPVMSVWKIKHWREAPCNGVDWAKGWKEGWNACVKQIEAAGGKVAE